MIDIFGACLAKISRSINYIVPKAGDRICIHSLPDRDDMTRALLDEITRSGVPFEVVILTHGVPKLPGWLKGGGNLRQYRKSSVPGLWAYFRSKYIFFTHSCFSRVRPVPIQVTVNLWHGMPIKNIGRYSGPDETLPFSTYVISTSPFFSKIMAHALSIPTERVLEVGLPRNDILLKEQNTSLKFQICGDQKLIIWLPTYRQSVLEDIGLRGKIRSDGEQGTNVFNLPDLELDALNDDFKQMKFTVLVKPHPYATRQGVEPMQEGLSNIMSIDERWLEDNETTLYELLSLSDMLITDISSVLVDYLILDKPIVCHFPDRDAYKNSRGMIWEFDPTDHGIPLVSRQNELVDAVRTSASDAGAVNLYLPLRDLMHSVQCNSSQKLLEELGIEEIKLG